MFCFVSPKPEILCAKNTHFQSKKVNHRYQKDTRSCANFLFDLHLRSELFMKGVGVVKNYMPMQLPRSTNAS